MIQTAILTMIGVVILQHLGLMEAMAKVTDKIAGCHVCCTFWSVLLVSLYTSHDLISSVLLSAVMAYLSNFMLFVLILCQMLYNLIDKWLRILNQK